MTWKKKFGQQIKEGRQSRGWSQEQLAVGLSISRPQLSNYENGVSAISAKVAAEIAVKFGQELAIDGCAIVPREAKEPAKRNQLCLDFDKEYRFGPVTIKPSDETITVTTTVKAKRA